MSGNRELMIPTDRLRPILEEAIAKRKTAEEEHNLWAVHGGGFEIAKQEIAAATGKKPESVAKRMQVILRGWDTYGWRPIQNRELPASETVVKLLWEKGLIWTAEGDEIDQKISVLRSEGFTRRQIAEELGITIGSVGWRIQRKKVHTWTWPTAGEANELCKKIDRVKVTHVTFATADMLLTGLDLVHVWHTDLADLYEVEELACAA